MKKGILVTTIILIILLLGFFIGKYIYEITSIEDNSDIEIAKSEKIEDECTAEYEQLEEIKETNAKEEKVSPNAKITTNIYYDECGHTIKRTTNIENKYINLTEEELKEEYKDWEITEFSSGEIILYKEENGICNEHYMVREKDGYVAIYSLDNKEKETLKETTEIATQFLTTTDLAKLQGGIKLYGMESLNSLLEDLE